MPLWLGTSGWQYKHWNSQFYPSDLPARDQLRHYAARFRTVEVNATFYRLPEAATFRAWAEQTPEDFRFVIKASRFLTHMKQLKDPEEPVQRLMSRARELGEKLAVVLLQLASRLRARPDRLDRVLALLAPTRVACEPRHESWWSDEVRDVLSRHGAALCLADRGERWLTPLWRTAGWGYLRFHGGAGRPPGCYRPRRLAAAVDEAAGLWPKRADVYAFFNNDLHGCALRDAVRLARTASDRGWKPTRVPELSETPVR